MENEHTLSIQIETLRTENREEHKEMLTKLNVLCTQVAVTENKVESIERFKNDHIEEHADYEKTRLGYLITFILLGIGLLFELALNFVKI
jgi:hypothetical protein